MSATELAAITGVGDTLIVDTVSSAICATHVQSYSTF